MRKSIELLNTYIIKNPQVVETSNFWKDGTTAMYH